MEAPKVEAVSDRKTSDLPTKLDNPKSRLRQFEDFLRGRSGAWVLDDGANIAVRI
jgi:hypothetical protein